MPRATPHPGAQRFLPTKRNASLPQLTAAAQGCRGCDLYANATQAVFGEGNLKPLADGPSMMLVGEQPGDQEDRLGHPFVGPAGRLLDKALEQAGVDRRTVYVTNAVKHFKWTPDPRGKRRIHAKPSVAQVRACFPWLERELLLVRPAVVVPMGATAGQSLLGSTFRVGASRGKACSHVIAGVAFTIVPTVHPSSILRARDQASREKGFAALVADLGAARRELRRAHRAGITSERRR